MMGFLTSRLAGPIATGAAVFLLIAITIQTVRLIDVRGERDKAQIQVSTLTADLATCRGNTATLELALSEQNAALAVLEARTEALREASREALAEAEIRASEAERRLSSARAAMTGDNACERAATLGAQFLFGGVQ